MGNKYTVLVWNIHKYEHDFKTMKMIEKYAGKFLLKAVYVLLFEKVKKAGCVTLEWR